jgi:hypothetical protein
VEIASTITEAHSHGNVEEHRQQEFVVNGHGDEAALVELGGGLPHYDAQTNSPHKEHDFHCKQVT